MHNYFGDKFIKIRAVCAFESKQSLYNLIIYTSANTWYALISGFIRCKGHDMARGVNKVILIGNLGDEPTCRQTHGGCSVTNISMVTNEVRRSIDTGETTEYAEWHRVVMWGKLADIAKQYLHKGSQIYIEGKLRTRSFLDKQGQKRSVTEVVADEMQMLGLRPGSGAGNTLPQGNPYRSGSTQNMPAYANGAGAGGYDGGSAYQNQGYHGHGQQMNGMGPNGAPEADQPPYRPPQGQRSYEPPPRPLNDQGPGGMDMPGPGGREGMAAGGADGAAEGKKLSEPSLPKMDDDIPF